MKNIYRQQHHWISIASFKIWKPLYITMLIGCLTGCDDFVDVELPKDQLVQEAVFQDISSATSALRYLYERVRIGGIPAIQMGLYADELNGFNSDFYDHTIIASNTTVTSHWGNYYNSIYAANAVIEGVDGASSLSPEEKAQLKGEALFIRAYIHTTLVELFGPVPYIRTTDHVANTKVSRMAVNTVYEHIIQDLKEALELLGGDVSVLEGEQKIRVYDAVVQAFLARVYLYAGQWVDAEDMATKVIEDHHFVLEPDVNEVFLKNASGTIWQFKPENDGDNTEEAKSLIFSVFPGFTQYNLSNSLISAFESDDDLRRINWIGNTTNGTYHYAFKYKEATATPPESLEYSIPFRLAEQYLIRAEARANQEGKFSGAQSDLNAIRNRAGLGNTLASTTSELLDAIQQERFVELFTEGGHRWIDLNRAEKEAEVLAPIKLNWRDTDVLLPIPQTEIMINPNLLPQNDGYNL